MADVGTLDHGGAVGGLAERHLCDDLVLLNDRAALHAESATRRRVVFDRGAPAVSTGGLAG